MRITVLVTALLAVTLSARSQTLQKQTVQIELGYGAIVKELFNRRQDVLNKTFQKDYAYCSKAGTAQRQETILL